MTIIRFILLSFLIGCPNTPDGEDTGTDPAKDGVVVAPDGTTDPGEGLTFCAGGGEVSGNNISGVICMSPLDISAGISTNDQVTWQSGPIYVIAP